jgi:hypothetical protein
VISAIEESALSPQQDKKQIPRRALSVAAATSLAAPRDDKSEEQHFGA